VDVTFEVRDALSTRTDQPPTEVVFTRGVLHTFTATSVQVLQEVFVTLTRKIPRPLDVALARGIVSDLATWPVVRPGGSEVLAAIDGSARWRIAFWDAMIVVAAQRPGACLLWSEDLSDRQQSRPSPSVTHLRISESPLNAESPATDSIGVLRSRSKRYRGGAGDRGAGVRRVEISNGRAEETRAEVSGVELS
jgi:predicted nucleic acid-binding protein